MKKLLLALVLSLPISLNAQITTGFCDDIAFIAKQVMMDRQDGRPKEFNELILGRMSVTGKERAAFSYVLDRAYRIDVTEDQAKKQVIPDMFSNTIYKACTKGLFD